MMGRIHVTRKNKTPALWMLVLLFLSACSGGETGTGGKPEEVVSVGVITGFGSIFVNGVKFDSDKAEIYIDDERSTEQALHTGMVVVVNGSIDPQNKTAGVANRVSYESDIEGLVTKNDGAGTLEVVGQLVHYDDQTVFDSNVSSVADIRDIKSGAEVEVSGYLTGNGELHATRVELEREQADGGSVKIRGRVTQLTAGSFYLGNLQVIFDAGTHFDDITADGLREDLLVKVKGNLNEQGQLLARNIHFKKPAGAGSDRTVEMEGMVGQVSETGFLLNGVEIQYDSNTEFKEGDGAHLIAGAKVEVKGRFISDTSFYAREIKLKPTAKIDITGRVNAVDVDNSRVQVLGEYVNLTTSTLMKDQNESAPVREFQIQHVNINDRVRIKGFKDIGDDKLVATHFRRLEIESTVQEIRLKGELEEVTDGQIVVAKIDVQLPANAPPITEQDAGRIMVVDGSYDVNEQKVLANRIQFDEPDFAASNP